MAIAERDLYPSVIKWLNRFLKDRLPQGNVQTFDTSNVSLNRFIEQRNLQTFFTSDIWQTFDIHVDITSFISNTRGAGLVFVECKTNPVTLRDVSQLLGYSRVALPLVSLLISPGGISNAVLALILKYDRTDILQYRWPKSRTPQSIIVAGWNLVAEEPTLSLVIPPAALSGIRIEL